MKILKELEENKMADSVVEDAFIKVQSSAGKGFHQPFPGKTHCLLNMKQLTFSPLSTRGSARRKPTVPLSILTLMVTKTGRSARELEQQELKSTHMNLYSVSRGGSSFYVRWGFTSSKVGVHIE